MLVCNTKTLTPGRTHIPEINGFKRFAGVLVRKTIRETLPSMQLPACMLPS